MLEMESYIIGDILFVIALEGGGIPVDCAAVELLNIVSCFEVLNWGSCQILVPKGFGTQMKMDYHLCD